MVSASVMLGTLIIVMFSFAVLKSHANADKCRVSLAFGGGWVDHGFDLRNTVCRKATLFGV
jgi:hypothetical protein